MADKKKPSGGQRDPRDEVRRGASRGSTSQTRGSSSGSASSKNTSSKSSSQKSASSKSTSSKNSSSKSSSPKNSSANSASSKSTSPKSSASRNTSSKSTSSKDSQKKTGSASSGKRKSSRKSIIPRGNDDRSRIIRTCIKLFLVLLAIILIVTAWRNRVEWSCTNIMQCAKDTPEMVGIGSGFPVSALGSDVLAEDEMAGGIAVLTDTAMAVYNASSKQVMNRAHYLGTPAMKTAGRYALLTDIGGTKYQLETVSGTLASGSTDMPVIGGAVSRGGRFAIITQGSSYSTSKLSMVEVFSRDGEPLHIWHSAFYYITEAALSPDGKYLAMAGVSAKDGILHSSIIIHRVGKEGTLREIELSGSLCLTLEYTNTGVLYAVCDNRLAVIDSLGENVELLGYNGTLQAYDISCDTGAAVYTSTSPDEASGMLTLYDSRGQLRWTKEVALHGIAVSLSSNGCCVLGRGSMNAYSLIGENLGSWSAAVSADDVLMLGSRAYMVEGISISQINLNRSETADSSSD